MSVCCHGQVQYHNYKIICIILDTIDIIKNSKEDMDGITAPITDKFIYQQREVLENRILIAMITVIMLVVCLRLYFKDSNNEKTFPKAFFDIIKETSKK